MSQPVVEIAINGGAVSSVVKNGDVKVIVIDYDTDMYAEDELTTDRDGTSCKITTH